MPARGGVYGRHVRRAVIAPMVLVLVGCASASAQPAEGAPCESAHDCVVFTYPCDCCHCPAVTSRARLRHLEHVWAADDCDPGACTPDLCREPCPAVHAACVGHVCVGR